MEGPGAYEPSNDEFNKAEGMMDEGQKIESEVRQKERALERVVNFHKKMQAEGYEYEFVSPQLDMKYGADRYFKGSEATMIPRKEETKDLSLT